MLAALLALGAAGCVTRADHERLQAAYASATSERDALEDRVSKLELENSSLDDQLAAALDKMEDQRLAKVAVDKRVRTLEDKSAGLESKLEDREQTLEKTSAALAEREKEIAKLQSSYDGLVSDLETEVAAGQIEIERLREGLRMNVSDDVLFAPGSAELDPVGKGVLQKVAKQIKGLDDLVEVRGYTDDRKIHGKLAAVYPTNWELAGARAARVVRLLQEAGVPGERLMAVSRAQYQPKASNDTAEGRAQNRRIEIRLRPVRGEDFSDEAAAAKPKS